MSKRLDENLGSVGYENLFNSLYPPAEVFSVTIRKEAAADTVYKRGTLMALSDIDGKCVIFGSTAKEFTSEELQGLGQEGAEESKTETLAANCVLAEDVEVGTKEDALAVAYRTGHFNGNMLTTKDEATISAADKEALRDVGILISDAVEI